MAKSCLIFALVISCSSLLADDHRKRSESETLKELVRWLSTNCSEKILALNEQANVHVFASYVAVVDLNDWKRARKPLIDSINVVEDGDFRNFLLALLALTEVSTEKNVTDSASDELLSEALSCWEELIAGSLVSRANSTCPELIAAAAAAGGGGNGGNPPPPTNGGFDEPEPEPESGRGNEGVAWKIQQDTGIARSIATYLFQKMLEDLHDEYEKADREQKVFSPKSNIEASISLERLKAAFREYLKSVCKKEIGELELEELWKTFLQGKPILVCSSDSSSLSSRREHFEIRFVYQSGREGNIWPNKCAGVLGGIDQELNWHDSYCAMNPKRIYVDGGNLFASPIDVYSMDELPTVMAPRAHAIVSMMNRMDLKVFAPGPGDYRLGIDELCRLKDAAKFEFVSSNVIDANGVTLFKPYSLVDSGDGVHKIAFVSLVPEDTVVGVGYQVTESIQAMRNILPALQEQSSMIILLSSNGNWEHDEELLRKNLPEINILVGCDQGMTVSRGEIRRGIAGTSGSDSQLHLDAHGFGFMPGFVEGTVSLPFSGFYQEASISSTRSSAVEHLDRLVSGQKHSNRDRWIRDLRGSRNRYSFAPIINQTRIVCDTADLGSDFAEPNEFTPLMQAESQRKTHE